MSATLRRTGAVVGLAVVLGVLLYPLIWMVAASVKPPDEVLASNSLLPSEVVLSNFSEGWVVGDFGLVFGRFFANSFVVAAGSVLGNLISCTMAAYAFARLRFRLRGPLFAFMLLTIMLPFHVTVIPQYVLFQRMDLINSFAPLLLPKFLATEAFFVFLIVQFMRAIPRELEQSAAVDGCGSFRVFWHIVLPLARPALITTSIFTFIWAYNDFFPQLLYLGDPARYTVPLGLQLFIDQSTQSSYGPMFAMSVLALAPILLFFLAFQRYLIDGVATTGLRG